jgi:hypothetical protein
VLGKILGITLHELGFKMYTNALSAGKSGQENHQSQAQHVNPTKKKVCTSGSRFPTQSQAKGMGRVCLAWNLFLFAACVFGSSIEVDASGRQHVVSSQQRGGEDSDNDTGEGNTPNPNNPTDMNKPTRGGMMELPEEQRKQTEAWMNNPSKSTTKTATNVEDLMNADFNERKIDFQEEMMALSEVESRKSRKKAKDFDHMMNP